MRKVEMAQRIAEEMEVTKVQAEAAVEAILAVSSTCKVRGGIHYQ